MSKLVTQAYIDGRWVNGVAGTTFESKNPATGEVLGKVTDCSAKDVDLAVEAASRAFETFKHTTALERANILLKMKEELLARKQEVITLLCKENGKPLPEAEGELNYSVSFLQWFAEEARRHYGDVIPSPVKSKRLMTIRQPIGVVAFVTPWNFPIAMITRKMGAALAAGCPCVIKPAEDTVLISLLLVKIIEDAGTPKGLVNIVPCSREKAPEVGSALCANDKVRVLSFTGSSAVGQLLYKQCGGTLKKLSLELGGDAPFIVFPSANLQKTVKATIASKFRNCGQTCVSANKILVHSSIIDKFVAELAKEMSKELVVGNGMDKGVTIGPLINERQLERTTKIVNESVAKGAKVVVGGKHIKGLFYEPTILTNVTSDMPAGREELFGPVAAIRAFDTEEEALRIANDTKRGLAGFFFTNDLNQSVRVAEKLEVGLVGVNEGLITCCEGPFGGVKYSGFGKEGSRYGMDEYTDMKYICVGGVE